MGKELRKMIYGAGSLGTVLGAYLSRAGEEIELVSRNREHIRALKSGGVRITGTVSFTARVNAILPEEMKGTYDLIFLMTKQQNNEEVVSGLMKYLREDGLVVTFQNGLPEALIERIAGKERTMGCTVEWGATLSAPGECTLTSAPDRLFFHMGRKEGVPEEKILSVKTILEKMGPVIIEDDLNGVRWSKLLINAAFSGVGTVTGGTYGDVARGRQTRKAVIACMNETAAVAKAEGVKLSPMQGIDLGRLFPCEGFWKRALVTALIPIAMRKHTEIYPSMLQDIEKGKPCEIESFNAVVSEHGRKNGIQTPVNDLITKIIREIDRGERKAEASNLALLKDSVN